MLKTEILEIRPRWNFGYANDPSIELVVRGLSPFRWEDWLYVPEPSEARSKVMLVSVNNWPWCKFVYIGPEPQGNPSYHGALGGEYHIADKLNNTTGEIFKTRTGWSSRAGVVNTKFRHMIPGEIAGVIVYCEENKSPYSGGMAGYAISAEYLRQHPLWPNDLYLVRQEKFRDGEIYHTISTSADSITKPEQED